PKIAAMVHACRCPARFRNEAAADAGSLGFTFSPPAAWTPRCGWRGAVDPGERSALLRQENVPPGPTLRPHTRAMPEPCRTPACHGRGNALTGPQRGCNGTIGR